MNTNGGFSMNSQRRNPIRTTRPKIDVRINFSCCPPLIADTNVEFPVFLIGSNPLFNGIVEMGSEFYDKALTHYSTKSKT